MTTSAHDVVARLYELVGQMADQFGVRALGDCNGTQAWATKGVYFFLDSEEPSEFTQSAGRIVHIGTHGLRLNASSTLWGRLRTIKGQADGFGNHRGSVYRHHVGRALLARERTHHPTWGVGSTASREVREGERYLEMRVSDYLARLYVTYLPVLDEPGPESERGYIERNVIAALSAERNRWSQSSSSWLGRHSPSAVIEASGLWNVQHVGHAVEPGFLDAIQKHIAA